MMPDITKCGGEGCPQRDDCWRYVAPAETGQAYAAPAWDGMTCLQFWPVEFARPGRRGR